MPPKRNPSQPAAQPVAQLKSSLASIAADSGAGVFIVDDIVERTLSSALKVGPRANACGNLAFVDQAVADAAKSMVGGSNLDKVKAAVKKNIAAVTCGAGGAVPKAQFVSRLQRYAPRNVQGYPVLVEAEGKMATFVFKTEPFVERRVRIPVKEVAPTRNAQLRLHSDGTVTYVRTGREMQAVMTVKSVAPIKGQKGWVRAEFRRGKASFGSVPVRAPAVVGQNAVVFVHPQTKRVTQFVSWADGSSSSSTRSFQGSTPRHWGNKDPVRRPVPNPLPAWGTREPARRPVPDPLPGLVGGAVQDPVPQIGTEEVLKDNKGGLIASPEQLRQEQAARTYFSGQQARHTQAGGRQPRPATAAPSQPLAASAAPGKNVSITIRNSSEDRNEAGVSAVADMLDPLYLQAEPETTPEPDPTSAPEVTPPPAPAPVIQQVVVQAPTTDEPVDPNEDTLFGMRKRTVWVVACMCILACALVGLGYWVYRKKAVATGTADMGTGGLDDLGMGAPGLGGFDMPRG